MKNYAAASALGIHIQDHKRSSVQYGKITAEAADRKRIRKALLRLGFEPADLEPDLVIADSTIRLAMGELDWPYEEWRLLYDATTGWTHELERLRRDLDRYGGHPMHKNLIDILEYKLQHAELCLGICRQGKVPPIENPSPLIG